MYNFIFSEPFYNDIEAAYDNIEDIFDQTTARKNLFKSLDNLLDKLQIMPFAWSLAKDEYLSSFGYRIVPIRKYILFFVVNEDEKTIEIHRFLHSSRD